MRRGCWCLAITERASQPAGSCELLASLRSHRCSQDRDLIQRGESSSRLKAWVGDEAGDELAIELRRQGGRRVQRNGKLLERHADLIGPLRCVGFSALDLSLVRGEPSGRRDWLDRVVQQLEPVYGELLSRHGRLLRQRSQLLKRQLSNRDELLDAFDQQLAVIGTRLHRRRHRALKRLEPLAAPGKNGSVAAANACSCTTNPAPSSMAKKTSRYGSNACWISCRNNGRRRPVWATAALAPNGMTWPCCSG